ncbi:hypothetical protein AALO_G00168980 [Alosa alosa]|uniref:Uncharacterized protein n=1 Tax=Alosa alosa TaxID=278164 RepID=A0AAV6GCH7_9TELE|nr:hypothetical protein AALO_G00168980 [Alosa alosa]
MTTLPGFLARLPTHHMPLDNSFPLDNSNAGLFELSVTKLGLMHYHNGYIIIPPLVTFTSGGFKHHVLFSTPDYHMHLSYAFVMYTDLTVLYLTLDRWVTPWSRGSARGFFLYASPILGSFSSPLLPMGLLFFSSFFFL